MNHAGLGSAKHHAPNRYYLDCAGMHGTHGHSWGREQHKWRTLTVLGTCSSQSSHPDCVKAALLSCPSTRWLPSGTWRRCTSPSCEAANTGAVAPLFLDILSTAVCWRVGLLVEGLDGRTWDLHLNRFRNAPLKLRSLMTLPLHLHLA